MEIQFCTVHHVIVGRFEIGVQLNEVIACGIDFIRIRERYYGLHYHVVDIESIVGEVFVVDAGKVSRVFCLFIVVVENKFECLFAVHDRTQTCKGTLGVLEIGGVVADIEGDFEIVFDEVHRSAV